jgi:serine/threonine-protein kinase ULK/ATG1
LEGLLQRDPNQRMSFELFFEHPFIDLEHSPNSDSLPKARELVKIAVVKDNEGKISSAINYYCQALEYFIPALDYEGNCEIKEELKETIEQYVKRAEYLQTIVKCHKPSLISDTKKLFDEMSEEIPTLKDVHQMVILADTLEEQHLYLEALEKYKEAIELLMPLNEVVMSANKKKMISSEVLYYNQ